MYKTISTTPRVEHIFYFVSRGPDPVSSSFFFSEPGNTDVPQVKSRSVKCEMEVFKAYRRHATLTGLTLLMVHLASRQHILSSAVSHFFHVSFSLISLRYEALSSTSVGCFFTPLFVRLSLSLTFSARLFFVVSKHYIALSLTFAPWFLPRQLSFLFPSPSISPSLPLPNWCLFVCLRPDRKKRRLTLPGLGTPAVH